MNEIAKQRAIKYQDCREWSPIDALEDAIEMIKKGELNPEQLIIHVLEKEDAEGRRKQNLDQIKYNLEIFKKVKERAYSYSLLPQTVCESCRHEPRHGDFSYENQALFFAALNLPIEKHLEELIAEVEVARKGVNP